MALPISTSSPAATVTFLQQAMFGGAAANAVYSAGLAEVAAGGASTYAISLGNNFASTADAALSTSVLTNLGITATTIAAASYTALQTALTQAFAAYPTARGQVVLNLSKIISGLEGDVTFGSVATALNNTTVSNMSYSANTANTSAKAVDPTVQSTVGQTYTLTISATDVIPGTNGVDTIIGQLGQTTTLQSSDVIDGKAGSDTFRIVTDTANAAVAGFTVSNVETLEVQAQAVTTLGLENVTGVTTIRSASSNLGLTLNQVKAIADLEIKGALASAPITVNYQAAAVAGTADVQKVALNGNVMGALTVDGVETMAITTSSAASKVDALAGSTLATVTVAGDQSVSVGTALPATVKTVNASAQTAGGMTIILTNAADVAVTGGAGADSVTFTGALTAKDSFNGGDGRDTVTANLAEYTGTAYAVASKITNVETLVIADALAGAFDASKFTGDDTVRLATGYNTGASVTGMESGYTLNVRGNNAGATLTAVVTNATNAGTADVLNLQIGTPATTVATDGAGNAGTVQTTGIETINVLANGTLATGTDAVVLADTTATTASVTAVVITGANGITVSSTNVGTAQVTSVDASAATGNVNMSGVAVKATGAALKGGAGADVISGGAGADTVTAGAGADTVIGTLGADNITLGDGADKVVYTAATQSTTNSGVDNITDFVSGTDSIDISALVTAQPGSYKGNQATFSAAQNAMVAGDGVLDAVYQQDEKMLWIDTNDDGLLNAADFRINLSNTASVTAADLGLTALGNAIVLSAPNAVVNLTTNTNASAKATVYADTISSSAANMVGSVIDGSTSSDTLTITDATGALGLNNLTSIEVINLASGSTASVDATAFVAATSTNATQSINNTSAASPSTASLSDVSNAVVNGVAVLNRQSFTSTGTGVDTVTIGNTAGRTYSQSVSLGAGNDFLTLAGTHLGTLAGGDGTDKLTVSGASDISGATVSGFEELAIGANALSATSAQYSAFTTLGGNGVITLTTAGTVTMQAAAPKLTLAAAGGSVVNALVAATNTIVSVAGADTINMGASLDNTDVITGGGGADVLTVTGTAGGSNNVTAIPTIQVNYTAAAAVFTTGAIAPGVASTITAAGSTKTVTLDASLYNATTSLSIIDGQANDTITISATDGQRAMTSVSLASGGSDTVVLVDAAAGPNGSNVGATITGFTTGLSAAADKISLQFVAGTPMTVLQSISAAGTATTFATATAIVEIKSVVGTVMNLADVGGGLSVETVLANAIGANTNAGDFFAIVYGSGAALGTAGVYHVLTTAGGQDLVTGNTTVDLIATLTGVAIDSFVSANLI